MGKHCGGSREVVNKVQLDGSWSFQAQFKALQACNQEDDLSFKTNSVKEVTDHGRSEAIARLQSVLAESPAPVKKRKADEIENGANEDDRKIVEALNEAEADLRKNVRTLLAPLKELEKVAGRSESDAAALAIFRQLRQLNVTVECLKATKIAAELNKPCWRGSQAAPRVRSAATNLIKGWRSMYRAETGKKDGALEASRARQVRIQAVDLEEKVFTQTQKMNEYCRIIELVCQDLMQCSDISQRLLQGTLSGDDLVTKNAGRMRIKARAVDVIDVEEKEESNL
ncbi:unnamed protein product [Durusdinium trenchii]|uniref:TFIIS N-terminal domain-containing protein n=1 Tax=Durusdinium trenchii TaxID=1381693 RepID=A0ABP0RX19_9DINO